MDIQKHQLKTHVLKICIAAIIMISPICNMYAQEIKCAGTHPADTALIKLFESYFAETFTNWNTVPERDAKRRSMVSAGWFYHDMDGALIDFDGLTARQTKNNLQLEMVVKFDITLHQFENTAIITYKNFVRGNDVGRTFENYGSSAMVFTRENSVWKVIADINGREPYVPNPPAGLPAQKQ